MHRIIKMEPVGNRFKITLDGELQFYLYKGEVRRLKLIEDNEIYKYIDAKELELLITIAVERMPPQRQRIYKMSREQGMSNDEIAASLCINKRTVENHLTQALADIRKLLSLILIIFF